jgi:uncharacterized hydrophobic protein (TIGR00341 family)
MVPAGKRDAVLGVLDDNGVDYVMSDETSGRQYTAVVSFPIPTNAVEPILDELREDAGIDRDAYTVVIDAETVVSQRYEQLEKEWKDGEEGERIARAELTARAKDLAPDWFPFVVMTVVSAVVATAGVLLDSAAVVVGSMVIAPLIGPAMATSVGTVVNDRDLFARGVKLQAAGALLAVAAAAVFASALRFGNVVPLTAAEVLTIDEVQERLAPDVLSLAVALGAGVAGALSISSGVSAALVGVMIAAALVPPVAVIGIGIAWGEPAATVGATVLVAVNFLSINLTALATLWYQGYRPERLFRARTARRETLKRIGVLAVGILLLTAFLGSVTFASYQSATFEDDAQAAVVDIVGGQPGATLVTFEVEYGTGFPFRTPELVVVTIGYPPGTEPPSLAADIYGAVSALDSSPFGFGFNDEVRVQVHYTAVEFEPGEGGGSNRLTGGAGDGTSAGAPAGTLSGKLPMAV